jgi:hypothetical protein
MLGAWWLIIPRTHHKLDPLGLEVSQNLLERSLRTSRSRLLKMGDKNVRAVSRQPGKTDSRLLAPGLVDFGKYLLGLWLWIRARRYTRLLSRPPQHHLHSELRMVIHCLTILPVENTHNVSLVDCITYRDPSGGGMPSCLQIVRASG